MGLLAKLLGREESTEAPPATESETCAHMVLTPRWDNLDDIGHEDLATSFHCESCGRDFSAEETRELRSSEGNRVRYSTPPPLN